MNDSYKLITKWALYYYSLGWSVFPAKVIWSSEKNNGAGGWEKKPLVKWVEYQNERANENQIIQWFENGFEECHIGGATGKISGFAVLDFDKGSNPSEFPETVESKTVSGGRHRFYQYPGEYVTGTVRIIPDVDVRGDGNFVVLPSGDDKYEWVNSPTDIAMAPYPKEMLEKIAGNTSKDKTEWESKLYSANPEGMRNMTAAQVAGKILYRQTAEMANLLYPSFIDWNKTYNNPPLPDNELKSVWESIAKTEFSKNMEAQNGKTKTLLSADEIMNMPPTNEPFLVGKLIPHKGITVLSGYPESGKSWIILYLAKTVALGEKLFENYPTTKGAVLIVDEESGVDEFRRRMKMLDMPAGLPIYFYSQEGLKVDNADHLNNLMDTVRTKNISLVIFDPFSAIHSKTENNAEEMQRVMECLQKFNSAGAAALFSHHHRKELGWKKSSPTQSLRGSSVLFSRVDSHVAVEKRAEDDNSIEVVISQEKLRRGKKITPFSLKIGEDNEKMLLTHLGDFSDEKLKKEEAEEFILELLKGGRLLRKDILHNLKEAIDVGERTASDALRELEKGGDIKSGKEGKKNIYKLPDQTVETISESALF